MSGVDALAEAPWLRHHAPEMRQKLAGTLEYLVATGANRQDVRAGLLLKKMS